MSSEPEVVTSKYVLTILLYNPSVINKLYNVIFFHRILFDLLVLEIYQIEMYLYNK